jgi:cobalt-zinc-cadmium efflux system outer membrane protein
MTYLKILISMILLVPPVCAEEITVGSSLTLEQTIERVLARSPALQSATFAAQAAAEHIGQARQSTPLRLNIEIENFAGSGAASGADSLETTLSLRRILESGRKPELRGELAEQQAHLLAREQDAQRLDLLADTARRFVHVVSDQERLVIANDSVALDRKILAAVERRISTGKTAVTESRWVSIALTRSELELEHATHELAASRVKLATLWGDTEPNFSAARANLFALLSPDPFEEVQQMLKRNPDLLRFATRQRLGEARMRLAEASRRPDITASGGLRYLNGSKDVALVASVNIPFGSQARAAPAIAVARLANQREPLDYEQRRLTLYATLFEIYQELSHSFTAAETLRKRIIPDARRAMSEYELGYAAGRYSLLELTAAQRLLLDSRLEALVAAADYHRYRIEIDRLTGAAMTSGGAR